MTTVQSLSHFVPEIVLLVGAVGVLFSDLVFRDKRLIGYSALGVILVSLILIKALSVSEPLSLFGDFFLLDRLTQLFRVAALAIVGITILLSLVYSPLSKLYMGEYYALLLFSAFGLILMSAATNLLMIFLAIEFVSLISYVLVGFLKADKLSKEASLKYLLFGSVCSAFMLYGMSLLYGLTGTLAVTEMSEALAEPSNRTLVLTALVMIFAGLGFKISMAPFHLWAPDVYEGAPTPVTAFLTVGPKALGFVVLIRVLSGAFEPLFEDWTALILILSMVTMTVGNVIALSQTNIKRLIAYSSIAQAGYILMGIATFTDLGVEAVIVYAVVYAFTNLGLFVVVVATSEKVGSDEISDYAGLARRSPLLAGSLLVFFLSLAGIPPMAGFIGKYLVFAAVLENGYYVLAVVAALNSVVAAAYYFKVIKTVYLQPARDEDALACPWPLRFALGVTLAGTLLLGVMPNDLIQFVRSILPLS